MEFTKNETTGRFVVSLGGVVWNNCSVDADCPGYALCAKNTTWQQDPATCHCQLNRFNDGPLCDQLTQLGMGEVIFYSFVTAMAAGVGFVAALTYYQLYKLNKGRLDASTVSLGLAAVGALAEILLGISLLTQPYRRPEPDPITGKRNVLNIPLYISMPLVFFFSTLAAMNISLVWIKIADNAMRMKQSSSIDVINYRRGLFVYYSILLFGICASLAMQRLAEVIIFACIGVFVVGFTYSIALYKVGSLIKSFTSSSQGQDNTGTDQSKGGSKGLSGKISSPISNSKEVAATKIRESSDRPASVGNLSTIATQSNGNDGQSQHHGVHLALPKYRNPLFRLEKGEDSMKTSLRNIRVLAIRMIFATYLYFVALTLYLTGGGVNLRPDTDVVYVRIAFAWIWFQNWVLLIFVVAYLRDTAAKKLHKSSQDRSATSGDHAVVVVTPDSVYQQGTAISSSKPGSKEEL